MVGKPTLSSASTMFSNNYIKSFSKVVKTCFRTEAKRKVSSRKIESTSEYCMNIVRQNDNENFLCTLLLPEQIRRTAFAIRAFNIDISKIQDQISESYIGQMRVKFWDDCIENIYKDKPPKNPVAIELHLALKKQKLSKIYFKRLISSRSKNLNATTFKTISDMEEYADYSTASVYFLLLEAAGLKNVTYDHAASHLGKAQGLANLIRGLPHNIKQRTILLPQSLLLQKNITEERIYRGELDDSFKQVVFEVASSANSHVVKARSIVEELQKEFKSIFLPVVATRSYLQRLERKGFDVFDAHLMNRNSLLPFRLYWCHFTNKY